MSRKVIKQGSLCKRLGHDWTKRPGLNISPTLELEYCRRCGRVRGSK